MTVDPVKQKKVMKEGVIYKIGELTCGGSLMDFMSNVTVLERTDETATSGSEVQELSENLAPAAFTLFLRDETKYNSFYFCPAPY